MLEAKRHKILSDLLPEEPGYMEYVVDPVRRDESDRGSIGNSDEDSNRGTPLPISEEARDVEETLGVVDDGESESTRESDWSSIPSVKF